MLIVTVQTLCMGVCARSLKYPGECPGGFTAGLAMTV